MPRKSLEGLSANSTLRIGAKDVLLVDQIKNDDYMSGNCFISTEIVRREESTTPFRTPMLNFKSTPLTVQRERRATHDPNASGAVVLHDPATSPLKGEQVHVVLDPYIAK